MNLRQRLRKWLPMANEDGIQQYRNEDERAATAPTSAQKLDHLKMRATVASTLSKADMRRAKAAVEQDRRRR